MSLIFYLLAILIIISTLLIVAFYTLYERKILASIQRRRGPNIVGFWGILQPIADGLKLLSKEVVHPYRRNSLIFLIAPLLSIWFSFSNWSLINWSDVESNQEIGCNLFYIYALSSIGVYGIIFAGWSCNSRYAFFGSLRASSQLISYEISMGLLLLPIIALHTSLNLNDIAGISNIYAFLPSAILVFISILAETNRTPFDLPEAEAEIVAGFNIDYSSFIFSLFFLAEYSNMLWLSGVYSLLFLGNFNPPALFNYMEFYSVWSGIKIMFIAIILVIIRAAVPRYRFDHLLQIGWNIILPLSLGWFVLSSCLLFVINH